MDGWQKNKRQEKLQEIFEKSEAVVMDRLQRPVKKKKRKGEWVNVCVWKGALGLVLYTESIQQCDLNLYWGKKNDWGGEESRMKECSCERWRNG